jgi:hypothetical protein
MMVTDVAGIAPYHWNRVQSLAARYRSAFQSPALMGESIATSFTIPPSLVMILANLAATELK